MRPREIDLLALQETKINRSSEEWKVLLDCKNKYCIYSVSVRMYLQTKP